MKKSLFTLIAMTLVGLTPGYAVTVDDLVANGGQAIEIYYGSYKQRTLHDFVNGYATLEKTGDNSVLLKNFYSVCDVPFTLVGDKLYMDYTEDPNNPYNILEVESKRSSFAFFHLTPQAAVNQQYGSQNGLRYVGSISEKNGEYQIDFTTPLKIEAYKGTAGNYTLAATEYKNMYSIVLFKPNATVSDTRVKNGTTTARDYQGKVEFNDDGIFTFVNFGAKGYGIYNWQASDGMIYSKVNKLTGTIDRATGNATMDYQQLTSDISGLSATGYGNVLQYKLCEVNEQNGNFYQPLNGTATFYAPKHQGTSLYGDVEGGELKTLESVDLQFNPWSAFNEGTNSTDVSVHYVKGTKAVVPESHDVTLSLKFNDVTASVSDNNQKLLIDASWSALKNEYYVEGYELLLYKGKYEKLADLPTTATYTTITTAAKGSDYSANVEVDSPVTEVTEPTTLDYTLQIKANYLADSGLASSFHCLYPIQFELKPVSTGVNDVSASQQVQSVRYYNAAGAQVANPVPGFNIVVTTYTDGTTHSEKLMK